LIGIIYLWLFDWWRGIVDFSPSCYFSSLFKSWSIVQGSGNVSNNSNFAPSQCFIELKCSPYVMIALGLVLLFLSQDWFTWYRVHASMVHSKFNCIVVVVYALFQIINKFIFWMNKEFYSIKNKERFQLELKYLQKQPNPTLKTKTYLMPSVMHLF
jgi:hypothetical protein